MKLFVFEHCPYCVRAAMLVGYKGLDIEIEVLANDDVDTRVRMVGANMVPILQKADGSFMGESLDIVAYLDELSGEPHLTAAQHQEQIQAWLHKAGAFSGKLLHPRNVRMGLKEFDSPAAIAWYSQNKIAAIGMSFDDAFAASAELIAGLEPLFAELDFISLPSERANLLSYDDIMLYPTLRNLTAVKGLNFGPQVRLYIDEVTALTGVRLFDTQAM